MKTESRIAIMQISAFCNNFQPQGPYGIGLDLLCWHNLGYVTSIFIFFQVQPTNSMGSELLAKLHGHTNEHVQFEGAHQKINRSLLPCRHTDNDKCIGILGMHPCFY